MMYLSLREQQWAPFTSALLEPKLAKTETSVQAFCCWSSPLKTSPSLRKEGREKDMFGTLTEGQYRDFSAFPECPAAVAPAAVPSAALAVVPRPWASV